MRAEASVVVVEADYYPSIRRRVLVASRGRTPHARFPPFAAALAAHGAAASLVITLPGATPASNSTENHVAVSVQPLVAVSHDPNTLSPPVRVSKGAPIPFNLRVPKIERPLVVVAGVGTMPPQPLDAAVDSEPFARTVDLRLVLLPKRADAPLVHACRLRPQSQRPGLTISVLNIHDRPYSALRTGGSPGGDY